MALRIGLYGGSFNPIHLGHLILGRAAVEIARLDRLIFLPSSTPPHKNREELLDGAYRAAMVKLAIEGEPRFDFSDFDLLRPGPTYTIDAVLHFRQELGRGIELFWLIGGDSLRELTSWKRLPELTRECQILTAARAGFTRVDWTPFRDLVGDEGIRKLQEGILATPVIEISSTEIRERIREGQAIRHLVPEAVRSYIEVRGLYRGHSDVEIRP